MLKRSFKIIITIIILTVSLNWTDQYVSADMAGADQEKTGVKITYIGNEGFLIRYDDKNIMTDAPFTYLNNYGSEGENISEKVVNCIPPCDDIDMLFITHSHPDHYDVQS
ncbi:MBL fold metallo-hydrolase, partial [candidate division KSB1 bacterium]